ncbi:hypothetical protein RZS08_22980, partial [Arthrospira platensis SPKY1]|nr:hypothetical protein [Arthrospira platensis SPKY1]
MAAAAIIHRLSRRYDSVLLEQLIDLPPLDDARLRHEAEVREWAENLAGRLKIMNGQRHLYEVAPEARESGEGYQVVVTRHTHSLARQIPLTAEFFASHEYLSLTRFGARLAGWFERGAEARRGERSQTVRNFREVMDWLME